MQRRATTGDNKLKLGFFGSNCSSGLAATLVPERWSGSWEDNLQLAQVSDAVGIDFILPVARWKGYGGPSNFENATFETLTWASGLLAATKQLTVFGTVHVPLIHPVFAAKQMVTADHICRGRFGLNLVCGWNADEFNMFGIEQREHDMRYAYGEEWLRIVKQLWRSEGSFDFDGAFFHLKDAVADPKPYGGTQPLVLNAGSSPAGTAFASRNADFLFIPIRWMEQAVETVADAAALGRTVGVFTSVNVVCRPTQREAEEYLNYYADERADWEAVGHMIDAGTRGSSTTMRPELFQQLRIRYAAGAGGWIVAGDPDHVATSFAEIAAAGFTGLALGFVNYLVEFPYFRDEVLPRLARLGLRAPIA